MTACPCGSQTDYADCCAPYIQQEKFPSTPEALMRSRYTAYTLCNMDYIKQTMRGKALSDFQEMEAARWAQSVVWLGLEVVSSHQEGNSGFVEFIALYLDKNLVKTIHESSEFQRIDGRWYYTQGTHQTVTPQAVPRNMPCPCGSGKKFKNCHAH